MKLPYKKQIIMTLLLSALVLITSGYSTTSSKAAAFSTTTEETIILENGDYLETTITTVSLPATSTIKFAAAKAAAKTITKTKTSTYKNKSGTVLWSASIKATFTYNGTTSHCTSCSHSASAPAKTWTIKSISSSRSGNSATAKVIATHADGISKDFTKYITISCNKNGVVS